MTYALQYLGKDEIVVNGLGNLVKGKRVPCSERVALEFKRDKRFKVHFIKEIEETEIDKIVEEIKEAK